MPHQVRASLRIRTLGFATSNAHAMIASRPVSVITLSCIDDPHKADASGCTVMPFCNCCENLYTSQFKTGVMVRVYDNSC